MDRKTATVLGFGILTIGVGVYLMTRRRQLSPVGQAAIDNAGLFALAIPSEAGPYGATILAVADEIGVDPFVLVAIGMRESRMGLALDENYLGDNGHGHGIMQIDDRTWGSWLASNEWWDPYVNIRKGAEIFVQNLRYFEGKGLSGDEATRAALAGYNHGPGAVWANIAAGGSPDTGTAHGNYGSATLAMAQGYESSFGVA